MQDLINKISENAKELKSDEASVSALYDKYAPALYGRIIKVVKQKEIAEKILLRVFVNAVVDKNMKQSNHLSLFTSLLNHSRKKTYGTMKAMKVLESCCSSAGPATISQ